MRQISPDLVPGPGTPAECLRRLLAECLSRLSEGPQHLLREAPTRLRRCRCRARSAKKVAARPADNSPWLRWLTSTRAPTSDTHWGDARSKARS